MKYPDDRKRIRVRLNEAIDRFVAEQTDGRVEPNLLRDAVLAVVPITYRKRDQRWDEARVHTWIKHRWAARRREDGVLESSNEHAWLWVPKQVSEGGSVYQALSPGYHIQLGRATDEELARAIRWTGGAESGLRIKRECLQDVLAARQRTTPSKTRRRTTAKA